MGAVQAVHIAIAREIGEAKRGWGGQAEVEASGSVCCLVRGVGVAGTRCVGLAAESEFLRGGEFGAEACGVGFRDIAVDDFEDLDGFG